MAGENVNMTDLPEELTTHILSFLDAESILACDGVNAAWKKMTNDVDNKIWFEVCLKAGIYVEKDKFEDAKDWKAFLSSMLARLKAMKDSTCFSIHHYDKDERINAIYCHNDKIALAFIERIEIWNASQGELLNVFECSTVALHLKFDDNILVAASRNGYVSSWSVKTGNCFGDYYGIQENSILSSFDFLTDHDIVACSYHKCRDFTSFIQIWSMSSDDTFIMDTDNINTIGRVMLAPNREHPVNERDIACYLFSLTVICVVVTTVTLQNRNLFARVSASFTIPPSPFGRPLQTFLIDLPPWGLLFDGKELYIMAQLNRNSCKIWALNFKTNSFRCLENDERVINLLGVGEKYIVYEIAVENDFKRVVVASKITAERIAIIRTSRRTAGDYLCLADTSWLDGINGENDRGVVCALIAEDGLCVYVTQFAPKNE